MRTSSRRLSLLLLFFLLFSFSSLSLTRARQIRGRWSARPSSPDPSNLDRLCNTSALVISSALWRTAFDGFATSATRDVGHRKRINPAMTDSNHGTVYYIKANSYGTLRLRQESINERMFLTLNMFDNNGQLNSFPYDKLSLA